MHIQSKTAHHVGQVARSWASRWKRWWYGSVSQGGLHAARMRMACVPVMAGRVAAVLAATQELGALEQQSTGQRAARPGVPATGSRRGVSS
jgi:hypothetical protein